MPETESRIDVTHRLQAEGRWDEATVYRSKLRKEQKAAGKTKAEANEVAWAAMIEEFPPLPEPAADPHTDEIAGGEDMSQLLSRTAEDIVDLPRDILWVYGRLADKSTKPQDAPSSGAWDLLVWSRRYRSRFFENLLPKALAAKPKELEEAGIAKDTKLKIEHLKVFEELSREIMAG